MLRILTCLLAALMPLTSFGLGYEKGIALSGKHAGNANAAASIVKGAEGLIFNPAALVKTDSNDFVAGLTIASTSFEAPFVNEQTETATGTSTLPNLVYASKINDQLAWGFGIVAIGGQAADHGAQSFTAANADFIFEPKFKSQLSIIEMTPGISYQLNDKFTIGAAYRITYATAEYSAARFQDNGAVDYLGEVKYTDLEGYNFEGIRVGLQYEEDDWGLGITYRNEVGIDLEGKATLREQVSSTAAVFGGSDNSIEFGSKLPQAVQVAGHYSGVQDMIFMLEIGYYNYGALNEITVDGEIISQLDSTTNRLNDVTQNSNDSTVARLGYTYLGYSMPIRAGFLYVTQVNNPGYATPGGEAPGNGFGYSLGTSYEIGTGAIHFAADYSYNRADVSSSEAKNSFPGEYDTTAFSAHLGYQLQF